MAEGLKSNDPYKKMDTGKKGIRPDFLKEEDSKKEAAEALRGAEDEASETGAEGEAAGDSALDAAKAERGSWKSNVGNKSALAAKSGKGLKGLKGGKFKKAAIAVAGLGVILALVGIMLFAPSIIIGTIDYNLQDALGFTDTVAVLEKQSEYVTAEMMANGEMPSGYSSDLARNGIEMGQVTASGEFVRTDRFIANIDELNNVAAEGIYYANAGEGELVALYDNKIIKASEFVAAVESDPKMYAAYSEALDISARYYYSKDVDEVYKEMGLSRGTFSNWTTTGDNEKDEENFYEILNKMLDDNPNSQMAGKDKEKEWIPVPCPPEEGEGDKGDEGGGDGGEEGGGDGGGSEGGDGEEGGEEGGGSGGECGYYAVIDFDGGKSNASAMISEVSSSVRDATTNSATDKAAQLLNTAVSASEPYLAASAFMAVEEPIQRARIDGDGPVNEVMNALTKNTSITYTDVDTGETKTVEKSIMETQNFVATVGDSPYSINEADNFSRDRVVQVTNRISNDATRSTVVATSGRKKTWIMTIMDGLSWTDRSALTPAEDSLRIAMDEKNSDVFSSAIGGNRIIEGGSFISNGINQRVIGAMPSNSKTIEAYHKEVEDVLARRAEADRATRSPFDISSPNTFLGSLMRKMGSMLITSSATSRITAMPVLKSVASLTKKAVASLVGGSVTADGADEFTTMSGNCTTIKGAVSDLEGDLYCTAHNTVYTGYMNYTKSDWENAGVIDENGEISAGMKDFTTLAMDRIATVGVKSAEVCAKAGGNVATDILSLFGACVIELQETESRFIFNFTVDDDIATGAKFTLSSQNSNLGNVQTYSGFALYDTVSSLLSEKQSKVSAYKEEYYAKNPRDYSQAGRIASISGMTKEQAQIALNYAEQLNFIAKYDSSSRYHFGEILNLGDDEDLMFGDAEMMMATYALLLDKMSFADVRNRTNLV